MFNYVTIDFPESDAPPSMVYSLSLYQGRYMHEVVSVVFKDWGANYDSISSGSVVKFNLSGFNMNRDFYGYVYCVMPERTPGTNFTEVILIGGSFPLKQQNQRVFLDTTADQVVKQIVEEHGLVCKAEPFPRVYDQISQAGHSDWELLVRLAKQSGYTLRTENTEVYFEPFLNDYTLLRSEASRFIMNNPNDPSGSDLYSFKPLIGEAIDYGDAKKAAVAVVGVDKNSGTFVKNTVQNRNSAIRRAFQAEFFDKFDTLTVANSPEIATYEAQAAEDRNTFPYRALAEVIGTPNLRPGMPVYLDGLGTTYSGYWVILETEHNVIETELNKHTYTTVLTLGSNSLGSANAWSDNKLVVDPDELPSRTIVSNVRQTNIKPKSYLRKTSLNISPSIKGSFGTPKNRSNSSFSGIDITPARWASATPSLATTETRTVKPTAVVERLYKKGLFL